MAPPSIRSRMQERGCSRASFSRSALGSLILTMCYVAKAGSFTLDTSFQFAPLQGSLPSPSSASETYLQIYSPFTYFSNPGTPVLGESHTLQNAFNSATYTITTLSNTPSLTSYGISSAGIFDGSTLSSGGPSADQQAAYQSAVGFAGTLTMAFDCNLSVSGQAEAASCFIFSSLFSRDLVGPDHFVLMPQAALLDIRGTGHAHWDGTTIVASGSDYTLYIGFSTLQSGGLARSTVITVRNGIVISAQKAPSDSFQLPTVGSSGNFTIPAPVLPVTYDFRNVIGSDPTQLLIFAAIEGTGITPQTVPEPCTTLLAASALLILVIRYNARKSGSKLL